MKIYRMQNEDGEGMYRKSSVSEAIFGDTTNRSKHPSPKDDSKISKFWCDLSFLWAEKYYFGFASILQMRNWIYDDFWFDQLAEKGYHPYELEIEEEYVQIGNTQAIYLKCKVI